MGLILTNNISSKSGSNGSVFITKVLPTNDGRVQQNFLTGTTPPNKIVESIKTDTPFVKVEIEADSMSYIWSPTIKVNNTDVILEQVGEDRRWRGTVEISLLSETEITASSSDGAYHIVFVTKAFEGPNVISAMLGQYPKLYNNAFQTELKEDDVITISGVASEQCFIVIEDYGIFKQSSPIATQENGTFSISGIVSNRSGEFTSKIHAINSFGTKGMTYEINTSRILNQSGPVFNLININYPAGQASLKNSEVAQVTLQINNFDEVEYSSECNQLSISNSLGYDILKYVTRIDGDISITDNYCVNALKYSNGKYGEFKTTIEINNIPAVATLLGNHHFISSPNGELYTLTIECNNKIISANMSLPNGSQIISKSISNDLITLVIKVKDENLKGEFGFENIIIINASGLITNQIVNNVIDFSGFVKRTVSVAPWPNRKAYIGVVISNVNNLRCSNLSKDEQDSFNFNFKLDKINEIDKYTIVDDNENIDIQGRYFYNCDLENSISNTTGLMLIEIQEI